MKTLLSLFVAFSAMIVGMSEHVSAADVIAPINQRFAPDSAGDEVPDFQRHVVPLMGKLGCNGRSCHGSFQGQGGFRLSLFGYDFQMDHENLTTGDEPRINTAEPEESLALHKPTEQVPHGGGERMTKESWGYNVFLQWVTNGAQPKPADGAQLVRLDITPSEFLFSKKGESEQLKVVAVWSDGTREDVTPLCRYQSNDSQVAEIGDTGLVTSNEPGDTHVVVFYDTGVVPIPVIQPVSGLAGKNYPAVETPTRVDELVVEKLQKLGIVPSEPATDAEFLRRVKLDLTGTLPTPSEVEAFLADSSPDKRARKIDELLDSPAYAAWWTTRLCDFTGNSDDQLNNVTPVRSQASQDWYDWIYKRVKENVGYDEMVAGLVVAKSRHGDESYEEYCKNMSSIYGDDEDASYADREFMPHYWARRNFRQPEERAIGFAYTFLGIRIQCAQCHKHPFDQWTQDDFRQFQGFFTATRFGQNPESRDEYQSMVESLGLEGKRGGELRRELQQLARKGEVVPFQELYNIQPRRPNPNQRRRNRNNNSSVTAKLLGGEEIDLTQVDDPRQPLMDWLGSEENPYFARAFVNRVWSNYFGRGIVEPTDDLSLANPPSNGPLLDHLTQGFIQSGFDMKWLHREIANSRTYQLTWRPNETNIADERNFSRAVPRRLPAEVAYDALVQATASDEVVSEMQADIDGRAIALPGAGLRRNNAGRQGYALTIFGRSIRESNCDCDRSSEPSLLQTVFLQNDNDVLSMIDRRDGWVAQVSKEMGAQFTPRTQPSPVLDRRVSEKGRQALANLRRQLNRARENDNERQVKAIKQRIAALEKRLGIATEENSESQRPKGDKVEVANMDDVVHQAYLRTLGRYPNEDEMAAATEFVTEADDTANGVRGLLWALINTKEFIVNH